jgi:hypothetical protein
MREDQLERYEVCFHLGEQVDVIQIIGIDVQAAMGKAIRVMWFEMTPEQRAEDWWISARRCG